MNKELGSWFFLAALLTDVELEADEPFTADHCGTCTACLDACPTDAFVAPYVLDARRCISYLTIELRGSIPHELREGVGDWLFGCDVCQDVCPWNTREHNAANSDEPAFQPVEGMNPVDLAALFDLDETAFRARFRHTPLWRASAAASCATPRSCSAIARTQRLFRHWSKVSTIRSRWCARRVRGHFRGMTCPRLAMRCSRV